MVKMATRVFQLPSDEALCKKFFDGLRALEKDCKAIEVGGSVHDEITYADLLEKELEEHIGDQGVENFRQDYERAARAAG